MDPAIFTLVVWLAHGERLEEVRVPNLGNLECVERLLAIEGRQGRGYCIDDGGVVFPNDRGAPDVRAGEVVRPVGGDEFPALARGLPFRWPMLASGHGWGHAPTAWRFGRSAALAPDAKIVRPE